MDDKDWERFEAEEKAKAAAGTSENHVKPAAAPAAAPLPGDVPPMAPVRLRQLEITNDDEESLVVPCTAGHVTLRYPRSMSAADFALVSRMLTTFWKSKKASLVKP